MQTIVIDGLPVAALTDWTPEPAACAYSFPKAALEAHPAVAARWFADGQFRTRFGPFLIGHRILVDCGVGPGDNAYFPTAQGKLPAQLAAAGSSLEAVTDVVLTHLHVDHVGWAPFLPNARFHVAETEWAHWRQGASAGLPHHTAAVAARIAPLAAAGRLRAVTPDGPLLPGLRFLPAPGHTPGHQAVLLREDLLIAGDAWHNPAQIAVPAWCHRADMDPAAAIRSRIRLAEEAVMQDWLVAAGHFTAPFGRITLDADNASFVPISD